MTLISYCSYSRVSHRCWEHGRLFKIWWGGGGWGGLRQGKTTEKQPPPHWKVKPPSRKWFLEKSTKESETAINTCVSIIKQHWKKKCKNSMKTWFSHLEHSKFCEKIALVWFSFNWLGYQIIWHRKILDFILCQLLLKTLLFYKEIL